MNIYIILNDSFDADEVLYATDCKDEAFMYVSDHYNDYYPPTDMQIWSDGFLCKNIKLSHHMLFKKENMDLLLNTLKQYD